MRTTFRTLAASAALMGLTACDVEETEQGYSVEPARVEVERDTQRVRIGSDTHTVQLPKINLERRDTARRP